MQRTKPPTVVQWRPAGVRVTPVPPCWNVLPLVSRHTPPTQVVGDGRVMALSGGDADGLADGFTKGGTGATGAAG